MNVDRRARFTREWARLEGRGTFHALAEANLSTMAALLEQEAFDGEDLAIFLSVIASFGLALPILADTGRAADHAGHIFAVAVTEPEAGSDAQSLRCALTRHGDGYLLRGTKWCITNAPVATHFVILCRESSTERLTAVLLERDRPGLEPGEPLELAGAYSSPTGCIELRDVRVSPADLLGPIGDGQRLMQLAFVRERLLAPWPLLGAAARVLQQALRHVQERAQFGAPIARQQHVQKRLVDAYEQYTSLRALALESLSVHARGEATDRHASLVKAGAARMAEHVFREAIALCGSYGLLESRRYAEYLHDALCASVAGGTPEMHRRIVFDSLCLDTARVRRGRSSTAFFRSLLESP